MAQHFQKKYDPPLMSGDDRAAVDFVQDYADFMRRMSSQESACITVEQVSPLFASFASMVEKRGNGKRTIFSLVEPFIRITKTREKSS